MPDMTTKNSLPPKGLLMVVSGPSGVGKDTLLNLLFHRMQGVVRSVSATTRSPRPGEQEGIDYYFLTPQQFEADIRAGRFLEYAQYGSNWYGTPIEGVEKKRAEGLDVVLKIEVQGALQVQKKVTDALLIFLAPPSLNELEARLRARKTDSEESIAARLTAAQQEMQAMPQYHHVIVNDCLEEAVQRLQSVVEMERRKAPHERT